MYQGTCLAEINNAVDRYRHVIFGDRLLLGDIVSQNPHINDPCDLDQRNDEIEPGLQRS